MSNFKILNNQKEILDIARMVLTKESNSIKDLMNQLNNQFIEVVNLILNSKGKRIGLRRILNIRN